ncbi:MAG: hypothetical protein PHN88_02090 [Ignavibacteria bacterium]|nr:hypothetical protein [Ignavibacteria bacterium]
MKKLYVIFTIFALFAIFGLTSNVHAQNGPVLYFCESYGTDGEVGISDRFTTGFLTVMVKCDYALGLSNVSIQYDKMNVGTGKFEYYKKFEFKIDPTMKYIYFAKTKTADMSFDAPGIYRVYLLDDAGKTVTSSLIEVIK